MNINDPALISAARQIKKKPDYIASPPASTQSHQQPQNVIQSVSKTSITLNKPNSNENSAHGYAPPAGYRPVPPPTSQYQPPVNNYAPTRPFHATPPPPSKP